MKYNRHEAVQNVTLECSARLAVYRTRGTRTRTAPAPKWASAMRVVPMRTGRNSGRPYQYAGTVKGGLKAGVGYSSFVFNDYFIKPRSEGKPGGNRRVKFHRPIQAVTSTTTAAADTPSVKFHTHNSHGVLYHVHMTLCKKNVTRKMSTS